MVCAVKGRRVQVVALFILQTLANAVHWFQSFFYNFNEVNFGIQFMEFLNTLITKIRDNNI